MNTTNTTLPDNQTEVQDEPPVLENKEKQELNQQMEEPLYPFQFTWG